LFDTKAGLSVLGCAEGKVASLRNSTQHCCLQWSSTERTHMFLAFDGGLWTGTCTLLAAVPGDGAQLGQFLSWGLVSFSCSHMKFTRDASVFHMFAETNTKLEFFFICSSLWSKWVLMRRCWIFKQKTGHSFWIYLWMRKIYCCWKLEYSGCLGFPVLLALVHKEETMHWCRIWAACLDNFVGFFEAGTNKLLVPKNNSAFS
jgi:hypothetical protein